ncbi:MAG: cell division protein FtsA [Candidatus Omnitrophica bacterium]|nr:cell division protein FtsA [Candidatus Omnitrophota bacterium]MBU4302907.1 cell division protein FtsA [Candidatus Omnitrophota bacterium]MBU4468155.1 cell division protein FtsA [Candidatus Omnitrophota bacterium]MCG2707617.1 cell division protein FtsA [Candidatus Omnitrophota bacterium]
MLNNSYICAIDIGSNKISAALALLRKNKISNIYFDCFPSRGVKEGVIVDATELVICLTKILKSLKAESGLKIKFIHTNFSGKDILTKHSHAIIPLAERGNKVVTSTDIASANEQARILGSSLEYEIIHVIPSSYSIDSKSNVINPIGLYSHRLEVDLYLVCARLASLQSLSRVISQAGYEIRSLSFSGLATSKAVFGIEEKRGISVFCDCGSDVTELLIFKDGLLQSIQILPLGGNSMTQQLSEGLKINFELAEDIKRSYGIIGDIQNIQEDKEILVKKDEFYKPIRQRDVAEMATNSSRLICTQIKEVVQLKVVLHEIDHFIMVGKTLLTDGFIEMMESVLGLPVVIGRINNPQIASLVKENSDLSGQKYLTYLTSLGMICEEIENKTVGNLALVKPVKNLVIKTINRFKEVYQEYF